MKYLSLKTNEEATRRRREVHFLKGFFATCSSEEGGVDGEADGDLASRDCPLLIMTTLLPPPLVTRGQVGSRSDITAWSSPQPEILRWAWGDHFPPVVFGRIIRAGESPTAA